MKISIVFISILLTLSVFLPFLLFFYNGTKSTSKIKKHVDGITKDSGIVYDIKEIWRKNFIGISNNQKKLTYMNLQDKNPNISHINLEDLKNCNVIKNYSKDHVLTLKSLALELVYKSSISKNLTISFFNIDEDLSEDFEIQRIEKWHKLILNAISKQSVTKLAS